jgi:4-diphosphocytidyl-2-C-methyl-D-erythritol kinase
LIQGRGEKVTPLAALAPRWFVLLIPPLPRISDKTRRLYSLLDTRYFTNGRFVDRALKSMSKDKRITPSLFYNVFDKVAFDAFPGLKSYWKCFAEAGAKDIHLAGSGPALFAPADNKAKAEELYRRLHKKELEAYSVSIGPYQSFCNSASN